MSKSLTFCLYNTPLPPHHPPNMQQHHPGYYAPHKQPNQQQHHQQQQHQQQQLQQHHQQHQQPHNSHIPKNNINTSSTLTEILGKAETETLRQMGKPLEATQANELRIGL